MSQDNAPKFPRAAASLGASLLARKGGARPAMRRTAQTGLMPSLHSPLDDLGWNDMGEHAATPHAQHEPPAPTAELPVVTPFPANGETGDSTPTAAIPAVPEKSPVALQLEAVQASLKAKALRSPPPTVAPLPLPRSEHRKAAFTLRLDAERHLQLRLLSAVTNRSSQSLLVSALDELLKAHPHIADLAADPKAHTALKPENNRGQNHE